MKKNKTHCKSIGDGFWKVFVTEDSWDTFSFIMRSEAEPSKEDIDKVWGNKEKQLEKVF